MNALQKFKIAASTFALGAMMASCGGDEPGVTPVKPGGGTGTNPTTEIREIPVGANQKADYIDYDAATDQFKVKQTVDMGKTTIVFQMVDKKNATGPLMDTTGVTSKGSVLDPSKINVDAATKGSEYTFVKYYNDNTSLPLKISIPNNFIGEAPAEKITELNKTVVKKVPDASFPGVIKVNILNGAKSARENAQDMVSKLDAVRKGEKVLQLVGQTANGYDGTFVYGSQPGTTFEIGKISAKL